MVFPGAFLQNFNEEHGLGIMLRTFWLTGSCNPEIYCNIFFPVLNWDMCSSRNLDNMFSNTSNTP